MATVAENLQTILDIKNDIKTAIEGKGVAVGDVSFTEYSSKIDSIETGGGSGNLESITITANGVYTPNEGVDGYNQVNVNVQSSDNYSYYDGSVDVEGLKAIGWDDESIGMLRDNALHYAWQNDEFVVSEGNKALYGVINNDNLKDYVDNEDLKFMPYFEGLTSHNWQGSFRGFKHLWAIPSFDLTNVSQTNYMFAECPSLKTIPLLDTSNVTNMSYFFDDCTSLQSIPLLDTSNVTNMYSMFGYCKLLQNIPLLDTSNVTDMRAMFGQCELLTTIPFLDTSNVADMSGMFNGCSLLNSIPQLDTSNVTNMSGMFNGCELLTTIPPLNTSNVTNMSSMFYDCTSLTTIPLLDTSNVTDMTSMFIDCTSLQTIPLLNTSNVTFVKSMFQSCKSLTTIPPLNTSNVTNMSNMFDSCSSLTTIPQLDTSNVKTFNYMFEICSKLQSLPLLDFSNATSITYFFGSSNISTLTDLGGFKNLKIDWKDNYGLYRLPNLTYESIMNVINNLYDFRANGESTTRTLKINSKPYALLSESDIAVATAKGWTISK